MLKRKVPGLLSVVLFALCFVIPVTAQVYIPPGATDTGLGGGNAITGMVLVSTGQRLERRVSIRLQTMTKGDRVAMTDEYGNFSFRGLVNGDYTVVIDKEKDFQSLAQTVSIMQARGYPPQTYNLSLRLSPKAGMEAKPGVINSDFAGVPANALALYKKAADLAGGGDHKGAIEQLKLAIADYPKFTLAYNDMGVQYLKLNDLVRADDAFKSALNIDSTSFAPLLNHGIALFDMKKYAEAELVFRDVVKAKEGSAVGHYFLGQSLAYLGRFPEAQKELSEAVTLGGDAMAVALKEAHRLLAIIYSTQGDKKRQAAELEIYLKLAPTTPDAEQLRKVILQLKGKDVPPPKPE